jgi:hypothetical protein
MASDRPEVGIAQAFNTAAIDSGGPNGLQSAPRKQSREVLAKAPAATDLTRVRRERQRQSALLTKRVDEMMDRAGTTHVGVTWLYIWVAGSLGPGAALGCIEQASEDQYHCCGNPWVHETTDTWCSRAGLSEEDWVDARHRLRERGLIEERRRFDLERNEIIVEVAFVPDAFCKAMLEVRADVRDKLRPSVQGQADSEHPRT